MNVPVQITFRDMPTSEEIERTCWSEAAKLERFHERITGCRVIIAQPHHRHRKGNSYQVCVDVAVPGHEVVIHRRASKHKQIERVGLAIHEAFGAARRCLEDLLGRRRVASKHARSPFRDRSFSRPEVA